MQLYMKTNKSYLYTSKLLNVFNDPAFKIFSRRYLPSSFRAKMRRFRGDSCYSVEHDRTKTIFIHIPKTAGSTISDVIYSNMRHGHNHYRALDYYSESKDKFMNYFKFSFVRHPVDRFISAYKHLISLPPWVSEKTKMFSNNYVKPFSNNIDDFVKYFLDSSTVQHWVHFQSQSYFLIINKEISVNFLGKFENLNQDIMHLARLINLDKINEIPKINKSNIIADHNYHISNNNINRLVYHYYDDFINFDYKI